MCVQLQIQYKQTKIDQISKVMTLNIRHLVNNILIQSQMVKVKGCQGLIFKPELYGQLLFKNIEYLQGCKLLKNFKPQQYIQKGLLSEQKQQLFYVYEQYFLQMTTLGLLVQLSLIDYQQNKIKKHEKTLVRPHLNQETYAKNHVGPVIAGYEHVESIDSILHEVKNSTELFACWQTADGRAHKLWKLKNCKQLIRCFESVQSLYILDGHHRFQAAAQHLQKMGEDTKQKNKWIQALVYSTKYIRCFPQFRMLTHRNYQNIIRSLMQNKKLQISQIRKYDPSHVNSHFTLHYGGKFFQIKFKQQRKDDSMGIEKLDKILKQTIKSNDQQGKFCNSSIKFIPSITLDWENLHTEKFPIFLVPAPSIETIFSIANQNKVLPPKSTWLEPKPCLHMVIRLPE